VPENYLSEIDPMDAPDAGGFVHGMALIPILCQILAELKAMSSQLAGGVRSGDDGGLGRDEPQVVDLN
jgi:hypothetical protein